MVEIPEEIIPVLEDHLAEYVGEKADTLLFTSTEGIRCGGQSSGHAGLTPARGPG